LEKSTNDELDGPFDSPPEWPAQVVMEVPNRLRHVSSLRFLILWQCNLCDGYFTHIKKYKFDLNRFTEKLKDRKLEDRDLLVVSPLGYTPIPVEQVAFERFHDEIVQAAARLVEKIPCTCEFHRV
jgi:hypothetical protein